MGKPGIEHLSAARQPEALSVAAAAAHVSVSRTFLYEAISSGALPSVRLGKRRLVRVEALQNWLKSHETKSA
jgi:excisionase family DNA binding protein